MYKDGSTTRILRADDDLDVWEPFNPISPENAPIVVRALNGFPEVEMQKFREELEAEGDAPPPAPPVVDMSDFFPEDGVF